MKKKVYLFDAVLNQYQEEDEGTMFIENIKLVKKLRSLSLWLI